MSNSEDEDFLKSDIMIIDWEILNQLVEILDTQNAWKRLLAEVPVDISRTISQGNLEREGRKISCSSAKLLLQELSTRGGIVRDLIVWLEQIDLTSALLLIKPDEPLVIVEEPHVAVQIEASDISILQLRCTAKGFPPPCYQWFKDDVEIITQQDSTLNISPVSMNDAGVYYCRVSKHNRATDGEDFLLSQETDVYVKPGSQIDKEVRKFSRDTDHPRIVVQPVSPSQDKIVQGSTVILCCKGRSKHVLHYQWYCDGYPIAGETTSELKLTSLYPVGGLFKWYYQCAVWNDYGNILSDRVFIELDVEQESRQYFAEDKVAILIANEDYANLTPLELPSSDVKTVSQVFTELGFRVMSFLNLNLIEMRNAVEIFCQQLSKGAYGIFFYAGHGFEQYGQSYLQPVDASRQYSTNECLCMQYVLKCMQETNPALCLFMLDTCRILPPQETWYNNFPIPGLIYEPKMTRNVLFSYSTSSFCSAHDIAGQENGPYVRLLQKHLKKKMPIQDILLAVQKISELEFDPVISHRQFPWTGGNLAHRLSLHDEVLGSNPNYPHLVEEWKTLAVVPDVREITFGGWKILLDFHLHRNTFWNALDIDILVEQAPENVDFDVFFTNDEVTSIVKTLGSSRILVEIQNLQKLKSKLHGFLRCVDKKTKTSHDVASLDLGYPLVAKKFLWQNSLSGKHSQERLSLCNMCPTANDLIDFS